MKAEIIAIGSELTCGARTDTNSVWLSQELEAGGWTVQRHTTVADDQAAMVKIFQDAASRSQVVLITGGLGPTLDDITRDTLAEAFDQPLVLDEPALQHIENLFRTRGREMPERNKVQALRPAKAAMIPNAHGTAPGILMNLADPECTIAVMPGVPTEMKLMFRDEVQHKLPSSKVFVNRTVVRTFGMGESAVEGLLGDLTARGRNPEVGITASEAVISLSITSQAASREECESMTKAVRDQIHELLGPIVFGEADCQLHEVVVQQLAERNERVALLEGSITGGILSQWLTESEDGQRCLVSSQVFANEKSLLALTQNSCGTWREFCVDHAASLLKSKAADYVLISSPTLSVTDENGITSRQGHVILMGGTAKVEQDVSMAGNLAIFRHRAARSALNLLRQHLLNQKV